MLIQVESLSHTYAMTAGAGTRGALTRQALQEISLVIAPGEKVGLIGPNGSGKSTLVQLLAGLLKPTAGRVLLDGVAAHERTSRARARRRRVGLALQYPEDQIFQQTVWHEVEFGPRNQGLGKKEAGARVRWALEMVGLDPVTVGERSPFTLSGGELRRVALASILSLYPEVLILDEPTAGLDPQGRHRLLDRVLHWQRETGHTLIMISHDLDHLSRAADRIVLLDAGRVVADGPMRRILSDGERLRSAGLDVPQPVALLEARQRAGWPIGASFRAPRLDPAAHRSGQASVLAPAVLPEEAAAEIVRIWAHGRGEPPCSPLLQEEAT